MDPAADEIPDGAWAVPNHADNANANIHNGIPALNPTSPPNVSNHFHITIDFTPTDDTARYSQFFDKLSKAFRGEAIDTSGAGPSGINNSSLVMGQPSTLQGTGRPRRSGGAARNDLLLTSSDDEPPSRRRSTPRTVVEGYLRAQDTHSRNVVQADSSSEEEPSREPGPSRAARHSTTAGSRHSDVAPPGVCNKCKTSIPSVILSCMHLYCEPCVTRLAAKRRPCVRPNCNRAFRSWKSLHV